MMIYFYFTSQVKLILNIFLILSFFVYSYLNRHVVDKLEVVNKKWVRINLQPGSSIDGNVR